MKSSQLFSALTAMFILTASVFCLTASAALTVNESYTFVLGSKVPPDTQNYNSPTLLTQEGLDKITGGDLEQVSALLRAGSALDLLGYIEKYGVSEERAYVLTQKALNILTQTASHTHEIQGLSSGEKKYLAAVLKAGYGKIPVPADISITGLSPELKQDSQGAYVSEVMTYRSVMGGILRFTDVPDSVKLYNLSGDEAPYLLSGQSFYFKSDALFSLSTLTAEHIYHAPEIIVSYHENSDYSPLVTAVISAENTVKDVLSVSFVKNPDTGDSNANVKAYAITGILSLAVLTVEFHRRRKELKISGIGH